MVLGGSGEKALRGARTAIPTFRNIQDFRLFPEEKRQSQRKKDVSVFQSLHRADGGHFAQADFLKEASMEAYVSSENLQKLVGRYRTKVTYPNNGLARQLKLVGQLIASDLDTKAYHVAMGGFDTHSNQANGHANLLEALSGSLSAFVEDVRSMGKAETVTVMTYSEFGRRVKENGSRGTDHGAAAPLFVVGDKVKGGIVGAHPSLEDLASGDLKYAIDFRSVYTALIEHWLGGDATAVFKGRFKASPLFA